MSTYNAVAGTRPAENTGLGGLISGISVRMSQYRTYRRTLEELEVLSDRELADLGLVRGQIPSIAYRAAYEG